jgi:hypothetical protein
MIDGDGDGIQAAAEGMRCLWCERETEVLHGADAIGARAAWINTPVELFHQGALPAGWLR